MSTFKQLQDDIIFFSQELQNEHDYNLTVIKRFINRGYYDFVKKTKCIEDIVDITSVAKQVSYTATDAANLAFVYTPYEVRFIQNGVTERGDKLTPYPGGHDGLPDNYEYGTPTHYWTRGVHTRAEFELGTYPIDSASGNTIRVYAYMFPLADLSADADQPLMKDAWQDALVNYTLWKLFMTWQHKNQEWGKKALFYKAEYDNNIQETALTMFTDSDDDLPAIRDYYQD